MDTFAKLEFPEDRHNNRVFWIVAYLIIAAIIAFAVYGDYVSQHRG